MRHPSQQNLAVVLRWCLYTLHRAARSPVVLHPGPKKPTFKPNLNLLPPDHPLRQLLIALQPHATPVERHLCLIALVGWIRGSNQHLDSAVERVGLLVYQLEQEPELAQRFCAWWQNLTAELDATTLLADHGFASRNAFVSEFAHRLRLKILPFTPETTDASELFDLVFTAPFDTRWITALDEAVLAKLARWLQLEPAGRDQNPPIATWHQTLLEAITFCSSQIRAAGFGPEMRLRMSAPARQSSPFRALAFDVENFCDAVATSGPNANSSSNPNPALQAAAQALRERLEMCRAAAATVYTHLDEHGISVNLVFVIRQLRERILRVRLLMDCIVSDQPHVGAARLMAQLAAIGQERKSLRALVSTNSTLLAAKVAERNSETGEHYITRTPQEYRAMLETAAGGGALTAVTTALKFAIVAMGLSAFWSGLVAGLMYAASFIAIQLLHLTLATKQPAMTAPAMAAKLKDLAAPSAIDAFCDEVTHLVRSQVAAVLGNVAVVFPVVVVISFLIQALSGSPMVSTKTAEYTLHSLTLLGPTLLYAAFTGVLLFVSSLCAGWAENWFVLHRLHSAIQYNPRITAALGRERAQHWAHYLRQHISGFAGNLSLGLMLGLVPAFAAFFGLGLDVRHVTLSAGQLGAACAALGWSVVYNPNLWWAAAAIPLIGALNLGVSFYLAFRVALRAHSVAATDRLRISTAILRRWKKAPLRFFWP